MKQLFSTSKKKSDAHTHTDYLMLKRFSDKEKSRLITKKNIVALFSSTCDRRNAKEHFGVYVGKKKKER